MPEKYVFGGRRNSSITGGRNRIAKVKHRKNWTNTPAALKDRANYPPCK